MTDRPILFSAPMIRALLEGRKTQTRRVLGPRTATVNGEGYSAKSAAWEGLLLDHEAVEQRRVSTLAEAVYPPDCRPFDVHLSVPWLHPEDASLGLQWEDWLAYYRVRPICRPGDRLWVRETFVVEDVSEFNDSPRVHYRATEPEPNILPPDGLETFDDRTRWTPSIHMPRWASRLTLVVTDVRVQRVQDISEDDAIAEGLERLRTGRGWYDPTMGKAAVRVGHYLSSGREAYAALWDSLNAKRGYGWDANPWVVALTFEVHKRNIDEIEA